jgi:DNA-binding MarR family transcriptional regulator
MRQRGVREGNLVQSLEDIAIGSVALTQAALSQAGGEALTVQQWRVILLLGDEEGGLQISAVARQFAVTLPATARLLRRLVRRGLVTLEPNPRDARARLARLTGEGLRLRQAVLDHRRSRLAEVLDSVRLSHEAEVVCAQLAGAFRNLV